MAAENKELSIKFYIIIGSERVVKRREILTSMDCGLSNNWDLFLSSSSKAESLDLKESDIDVMLCTKDKRVYEDDCKVFPTKISMVNSIMDTNATKPGFTLLRSVSANCSPDLIDLFHGKYISSKAVREYYKAKISATSPHVDLVIHGPCVSLPDESFDGALCFRCRDWILPAKQWISRPRNLWPDTTTIQQIVDYGVLFVPIGCKGSPNEDLEWRISFSVAEKELIYTFNHVQFLCYALLKIALNDVIKKRYSDLLCSYFLKTIMFWMCEESDQSTWKPENFIKCFMNCFRRLVYCVKYKICLHYFIPDNNFFEDRFTASHHEGLFSYLRSLNNSGWIWILHTDTLQSYSRYYNLLLCAPIVSSFQNLFVARPLLSSNINEDVLAILRKSVYCSSICENDTFIYFLSTISQYLAQAILPFDEHIKGNKHCYNQYRRCRCFLMIGLNHDAVSGWLLLASLFHRYKQYEESIYVIEYCLSKCTTDKILFTYKPDVQDQSRFERLRHTLGRGKYLSTCKQCLIDEACFLESSRILPDEIRCVFGKYDLTMMPSVVFGQFLKFLCFCQLGNQRGKQEAFRDLQLTVIERYFIRQDHLRIKNANLCLQIAQEMMFKTVDF